MKNQKKQPKTTKATAHKDNKKIEALKVKFPLIEVPATTVVKKSEIYMLETEGYKIYVELDQNTIKITTLAHGEDFVFNTVRNPVTKRRWQALGRLIIEATKLI